MARMVQNRLMSHGDELHYTLSEIRSYLPTGWQLAPGETNGRWDPALRVWTLNVMDGSDLEWALTVGPAEAEKKGRLEALRHRLESLQLGGAQRARMFLG